MIFHSSKEWTVTVAHILGFPRIGAKRELKAALESFWRGELPEAELLKVGRDLRGKHWQWQRHAGLDFVTVGDFAWYDPVLQTLAHLGCVPGRFGFDPRSLTLPQYFSLARGNAAQPAMEMTKWFDTNYHYLVPEWSAESCFDGGVEWLFDEIAQAATLGHSVKVALLGPLTLLYLGKIKSGLSHKLDLLPLLIPAYQRLLARLKELEVSWVQIDEPQYRLVDLHPAYFQFLEAREQALIGWNQERQQIEFVRQTGLDLAEVEQGERAQQGDLDRVAQCRGLGDFIEQPLHAAVEARFRAPLRHQVVIVGVEPLGHFHGGLSGVAARQAEVLRQRERSGIEAEPARHAAEMGERLQHRVVPGEIADGDEVQARVALPLPVFAAQIAADFQ